MRFIVFLAASGLILSVFYLVVSVYSRSVRREKLEKSWDATNLGGDPTAREAYIAENMTRYERSFRKKLILLVYIIPAVTVAVIYFVTN